MPDGGDGRNSRRSNARPFGSVTYDLIRSRNRRGEERLVMARPSNRRTESSRRPREQRPTVPEPAPRPLTAAQMGMELGESGYLDSEAQVDETPQISSVERDRANNYRRNNGNPNVQVEGNPTRATEIAAERLVQIEEDWENRGSRGGVEERDKLYEAIYDINWGEVHTQGGSREVQRRYDAILRSHDHRCPPTENTRILLARKAQFETYAQSANFQGGEEERNRVNGHINTEDWGGAHARGGTQEVERVYQELLEAHRRRVENVHSGAQGLYQELLEAHRRDAERFDIEPPVRPSSSNSNRGRREGRGEQPLGTTDAISNEQLADFLLEQQDEYYNRGTTSTRRSSIAPTSRVRSYDEDERIQW